MFFLPIIAFFLFLTVYFNKKKNIVESMVVSWLFVTLCSWIIVELFSIFRALNMITVLVSWSVICLVLAAIAVRDRVFRRVIEYCKDRDQVYRYWEKYKFSLICLGIFCGLICLISVLRSQTLVDNLYHRLTKIMHWMQNGKVEYFATWTTPEIKYANLIEYMMTQIYLLKGSDRFITIVQAGAYVCSGCCVYGISRKLGASIKFSLLSMWIFVLTPIIIIETITTQTDVVAGFYLLSFIYFLLDYIQADQLRMNRQGLLSAVCLSASVMFGYLAKPTVCFAMVIFFCWMCVVRLIKRDKFKVLLQYLLVGSVVAAILFLPDLYRNYEYRTAPNLADVGDSVNEITVSDGINDSMVSSEANNAIKSLTNPKKFVIVCFRNLAANSTSRCFPKINDFITRLVEKCESVMDYSSRQNFRVLVSGGMGETSEPSPAIMFFLLASWVCVLIRISKVKREQFLYLLFATISLVAQAGLMDYTLFRQRYLIGIMAVLCPAFVIVLENICVNMKTRLDVAIVMLTICSFGAVNALSYEIPYVIFGFQGENIHQYLFHDDDTELHYQLLLDHINEKGYTTVGMYGAIANEYVLWQGIDNLERMEHVNVESNVQGAKLEDLDFLPQCIVEEVSVKEGPEWVETMYCHGQEYICEWKITGEEMGRYYAVLVPCE